MRDMVAVHLPDYHLAVALVPDNPTGLLVQDCIRAVVLVAVALALAADVLAPLVLVALALAARVHTVLVLVADEYALRALAAGVIVLLALAADAVVLPALAVDEFARLAAHVAPAEDNAVGLAAAAPAYAAPSHG